MHIFTDLDKFNVIKPVITVGIFDGVHKGHDKIIKTLVDNAKKLNTESVIFTFWPHPQHVINGHNKEIKLLNTIDEKIELLEKAGIDHLIIYPFTKEFSKLSSKEFVEQFLVNKLKINTLIVGYDNHIGNNKEGNYEQLKKLAEIYNFNLVRVAEQKKDKKNISSTNIRNDLISGNIELANSCLGYNYSVTGKIIEGNKIGNTIGFPTANIEIAEKYKLLPADGVYAVEVLINEKTYPGMLNKGIRPTLKNQDNKPSIEIHIIDFGKKIYGEKITVKFIKKLRDEIKFDNIELLKQQLNKDKEEVIKLLKQ